MLNKGHQTGGQRNEAMELVVFDFDGTLVDTRNDIVYGANLALEDLGLPKRPGTEIAGFIGRGVENLASCCLPPDRNDLLAPMLERFRTRYESCYDMTSRPYPGVRQTLSALRRFGETLAVASNKPSTYVSRLLGKFGFGSFFAAAVGGDLMLRKKPDPWCIDAIRWACPVPAARTLMVGDMRYDVETGTNAGTVTCGVLYGYGSVEELQGADHMAERFADLLTLVC